MRFDELEHACVGIIGAGREGRSVWRCLRRRFPHKTLFLFSESALEPAFLDVLDPALDKVATGPLDVAELKAYDVLVRSAGVSIYRDDLSGLRHHGVRFTTASSLWFAENPTAKTICVAGTLGKSTTARLTAHLLDCAGQQVRLAGVDGQSLLDCMDETADWWVI